MSGRSSTHELNEAASGAGARRLPVRHSSESHRPKPLPWLLASTSASPDRCSVDMLRMLLHRRRLLTGTAIATLVALWISEKKRPGTGRSRVPKISLGPHGPRFRPSSKLGCAAARTDSEHVASGSPSGFQVLPVPTRRHVAGPLPRCQGPRSARWAPPATTAQGPELTGAGQACPTTASAPESRNSRETGQFQFNQWSLRASTEQR